LVTDSLAQAAKFMREHDDFLVVSHIQPDGDAIGSTTAVGWMLEQLGKSYTMMNEGPVPSRLHSLWGSARIVGCNDEAPQRQFHYVIAVDCADMARLGPAREWLAEDCRMLNIDHHATNDGFGDVNVIMPDAAATAEILFMLNERLQLPLEVEVATALYTGLLTDTGGFRYANTSPHVMEIASRLLRAGVNGAELAERLLERMSMGQMRVLQRGLSRLQFSDDLQIGWLWVTSEDLAETGAAPEDLEGLVNYPRNIEGVEVGILFKAIGTQKVKVSLRSSGRVNVAEIARQLGGGGHARAAGITMNVPLEEAIDIVIKHVRQDLEANDDEATGAATGRRPGHLEARRMDIP